jgi:two-component system sensor histidine kinase DegS
VRLTSNGNGNGDEKHDNESLTAITDLLERAMTELHDVIFALRPPDLDDLGVVAAIDRYVQQINRTGLPCRLEVIGEQQRMPPEARLGVYRIVQEALHNALRHADADEAVVKLEWNEDLLRVTIRDNGSGFDIEQEARPASLGLLSMRERAAAIGARLEIASRPGDGTVVILERPSRSDLASELEDADVEELRQLALEAHTSSSRGEPAEAAGVRSA